MAHSIMVRGFALTTILLLAICPAAYGQTPGTPAPNYPVVAAPALTDRMIGVMDPASSWYVGSVTLQTIIDLCAAEIGPVTAIETDPIVGAITGIPISDGAGNISAAVAGTHYFSPSGTSEIAGLTDSATPASTDLLMSELASDGSKAKITIDALVSLITPGTPYEIVLDDTEISITDDGVAAGQIDVTVDNTVVITITADGVQMGPAAATAALTENNTYSSTSLLTGLNAGESINQWATVYFSGTDGEWMNADANAAGKWPARGMAVAAGTNGNALDVITSGFVRFDTWNWVLTGNLDLCLSETAGGVVACSDATLCSAEDDAYQIIGWAVTADIAYFDFSGGAITCAAP
jgi:hypothetical protein